MKILDCTKCKNLEEVGELYNKNTTPGDKSTFFDELLFTEKLAKKLFPGEINNFNCKYRGVSVKIIQNKE